MTFLKTADLKRNREQLLLSIFEQHLNIAGWPQSALGITYSRIIQRRTVGQMEIRVCLHTSVFWRRNMLNVETSNEIPPRSMHLACEIPWCFSFIYHSELLCWNLPDVPFCVTGEGEKGKGKITPWDYRSLLNSILLHLDLPDRLEMQGHIDMARMNVSHVTRASLELPQLSALPAFLAGVPSSPRFRILFSPIPLVIGI